MSFPIRNLAKKIRRISTLPPWAIAAKVGERMAAFPARQIERIRVNTGRAEVGDAELSASLLNSGARGVFPGAEYPSPFFPVDAGARKGYLAAARSALPDAEQATLDSADKACSHIFDLLGSGEVDLGPAIDWSRDFKSGFKWPKQYCRDIVRVRPDDNSDIKVTRELSRCQHFAVLGKAYWYTADEKYAREFRDQISLWIDENPVMRSVNWDCAMDVAIRAVNWLWGWAFFRTSEVIDEGFQRKLLGSFLAHGRYIRNNLEFFEIQGKGSRVRVNGNHYLSDLTGLVFLGVLLPELKEARDWREFALGELWRELEEQVYPDGCCYESSISYHRLSLEIFLTCAILCQKNDIEVPGGVWSALEQMLEFVAAYTRPDGKAPIVGDADDGRLQILGGQDIDDHGYLLSVGAVIFERPDFKSAAGEFHEETLWLLGPEAKEVWEWLPIGEIPGSQGFPCGGFYAMRAGDLYLLSDCGDTGIRGHGSHDHSDPLSFELSAHGRAFVVDPGSYVYSSSFEWRNLFRSTAWHNTVRVDGQEANRFDPEELFAIENDARPAVSAWESDERHDFLDVCHFGYERLPDPVIHRRRYFFDKAATLWQIRDDIIGKREHCVEWFFHFASGVPIEIAEDGVLMTVCAEGSNLTFKIRDVPEDAELELLDGWVSRRYGVKEPNKVLRISMKRTLPLTMSFILAPERSGGRRDLSEVAIPEEMMVA